MPLAGWLAGRPTDRHCCGGDGAEVAGERNDFIAIELVAQSQWSALVAFGRRRRLNWADERYFGATVARTKLAPQSRAKAGARAQIVSGYFGRRQRREGRVRPKGGEKGLSLLDGLRALLCPRLYSTLLSPLWLFCRQRSLARLLSAGRLCRRRRQLEWETISAGDSRL